MIFSDSDSDNGTEMTSHAILRRQKDLGILWHSRRPNRSRTACEKIQRSGPG